MDIKSFGNLPGRTSLLIGLGLSAVVLSGCRLGTDEQSNATTQVASTPSPTPSTTPSPTANGFDIATLPVSNAPSGEFPYITLPAGYTVDPKQSPTLFGSQREKPRGDTKDFARYPFKIGGTMHWVEGKFYQTGFSAESGKTFSSFEVAKNIDNAVKQMGGQKVAEEELKYVDYRDLGNEISSGFRDPFRLSKNNPTMIWVVRRTDGNIWIALSADEKDGGYVVGKEEPLKQTSMLLTAADLKKTIAETGKASLTVNFATDRTDILPESQPQVEQVVTLLRDDPALRLAIGGHTDGTGARAHNQSLSEGRAHSVVAALVAKGIPASRLTAKGYGDSQPVADNGSEDGKAKNRRVELVRL